MHELEQKARDFAIERHGDQMYGTLPYLSHLEDVHRIVSKYFPPLNEDKTANPEFHFELCCRITAWLHDVVEDTETSIEEINKLFGKTVANSVSMITDKPGKNRKERKLKTYYKLARVYPLEGDFCQRLLFIPHIVKIADRLANVEACVSNDNQDLLSMYKKEHEMFILACYRNEYPIEEMEEAMEQLNDLLGFPKLRSFKS